MENLPNKEIPQAQATSQPQTATPQPIITETQSSSSVQPQKKSKVWIIGAAILLVLLIGLIVFLSSGDFLTGSLNLKNFMGLETSEQGTTVQDEFGSYTEPLSTFQEFTPLLTQ